jgi:hypothetical protein
MYEYRPFVEIGFMHLHPLKFFLETLFQKIWLERNNVIHSVGSKNDVPVKIVFRSNSFIVRVPGFVYRLYMYRRFQSFRVSVRVKVLIGARLQFQLDKTLPVALQVPLDHQGKSQQDSLPTYVATDNIDL